MALNLVSMRHCSFVMDCWYLITVEFHLESLHLMPFMLWAARRWQVGAVSAGLVEFLLGWAVVDQMLDHLDLLESLTLNMLAPTSIQN